MAAFEVYFGPGDLIMFVDETRFLVPLSAGYSSKSYWAK